MRQHIVVGSWSLPLYARVVNDGCETKRRTLRRVAMALVLNALGLPGCDTFDDEPPDTQAAPDGFVGFVPPATTAPAAITPQPAVPIVGPIANPTPTTSVPAGSPSAPLAPSTQATSAPGPTVPPRPRPPQPTQLDPELDAGASGADMMEPSTTGADAATGVDADAAVDFGDAAPAAGGGDAGGDASVDAGLF